MGVSRGGARRLPFWSGARGEAPAQGDATGHGMAPCQGKPEAVRGITAHNLRAEIIGEEPREPEAQRVTAGRQCGNVT